MRTSRRTARTRRARPRPPIKNPRTSRDWCHQPASLGADRLRTQVQVINKDWWIYLYPMVAISLPRKSPYQALCSYFVSLNPSRGERQRRKQQIFNFVWFRFSSLISRGIETEYESIISMNIEMVYMLTCNLPDPSFIGNRVRKNNLMTVTKQ